MSSQNLPQRLLILAAVVVVAVALPAPVAAHGASFVTRTLTQPAARGLSVSGPLSDLVVTSRARVVVPTAWRRSAAPAGRLRFTTTQNPSCHYNVTYVVTSVLASPQDAADRAAAQLPAASAPYVLDSGERGNSAFRVVRRRATSRVQLDALWVGVLTRRADIAPGGQVAWTEIRVSAVARAGDECHAGTWREALGPSIGDSLAVARTQLHFTEQG